MRGKIFANALGMLWAAWRRRYLIAAPILIMPLAALVVGLVTSKTYKTYTTILIQESAQQNPFLKDLTVSTNLRERMDALSALLHSRHILGGVALKIGLVDETTPMEEAQARITKLSKALSFNLVGDDLVQIAYSAEDPANMAEILELVSIRFVERIVDPQRAAANNSESFLEDELDIRRADLEGAERRLAEYRSKFASELPELHAANIVRLGAMQGGVVRKRGELQGAEAELTELRARLFKTNPLVGEIEERIVTVIGELAGLRARYTSRHTKVRAAARRLKSLEEERAKMLAAGSGVDTNDLERLWNMAATMSAGAGEQIQPLLISQLERLQAAEGRVTGLEKETVMLEGELASMQEKISGFGVHERRLGELRRDLGVKRKIFEDLAERHELARVTGSLGRAEEKERIKVIDPPFTPLAPSHMSLFGFFGLGILAGAMLGAGLAVCAELLDLTVRLRAPLERITGAPVLTRIPRLRDDGGIHTGSEAFAVSPPAAALNRPEPGHA